MKISDFREHYPYYDMNDDRWKNSVRHNLSISPHFRKGCKTGSGAGHLWTTLKNLDSRNQRPSNVIFIKIILKQILKNLLFFFSLQEKEQNQNQVLKKQKNPNHVKREYKHKEVIIIIFKYNLKIIIFNFLHPFLFQEKGQPTEKTL